MPRPVPCVTIYTQEFFDAVSDIPLTRLQKIMGLSSSSLYRKRYLLNMPIKWPYRLVFKNKHPMLDMEKIQVLRKRLLKKCSPRVKKVLLKVQKAAKLYNKYEMPTISEDHVSEYSVDESMNEEPLEPPKTMWQMQEEERIKEEEERKKQEQEDKELEEAIASILFMDVRSDPDDTNDYTWLSKLEPISIDEKTGWMQYAIVP